MEQTGTALVSLTIVVAIAAAVFFAYNQGYLDPLIEKFGKAMFKVKAEAEKKELQAEGQDFIGSQISGNKQAQDVQEGFGSVGGLKKQL